jgi:hypothetical protein
MSQIMQESFFSPSRDLLQGSCLVALVLIGLLTTCSSVPQPKTYAMFQTAETAIADADRNGVNGYSSPELVESRNKLQQARVALEMEQLALAVFLAQESQVDIELASAKATLIKEQQVNAGMTEGIEAFK